VPNIQIKEEICQIQRRFSIINSPNDFLSTDDGFIKLDGICMMLIAIGENLKNLDRVTNQSVLAKYSQVDWKAAKGVRDVICLPVIPYPFHQTQSKRRLSCHD
jgi:uncharacterized protein with HEPN domain